MPTISATIASKTFLEAANDFGVAIAIILVLGVLIYLLGKSYLRDSKKDKEISTKDYKDLVVKVQSQNDVREARYEKTIQELTQKSEKRDKEYVVIIKNLSENFGVLKEVLSKVEDIETKMTEMAEKPHTKVNDTITI